MPAWMTSLLREEVPLPIWPSASATMTSWPASAACACDREPYHAGADDEHLHRVSSCTRQTRSAAPASPVAVISA